MADLADDGGDGDIFIYRGGRAPLTLTWYITHALIDESLDEIEDNAFNGCLNLVQVDTHDGIRKVGKAAFLGCESLRRINLKFAVEVEEYAFCDCESLESIEFGDYLESIEFSAFCGCSLEHLKLTSVITIEASAFLLCAQLTYVEFSEGLDSIGEGAFHGCERLQRITIPLKRDLFVYDDEDGYDQFDGCEQLTTIDLVGGIHKTVASLHMESWRTEMISEINRINHVLPNAPWGKTGEILRWMTSVMDKMDRYKAEHCRYVKEGITLLELALWKAKLGEKEEYATETKPKKTKVDSESSRKERRITCGADIVIKNVLPFLQLE